MTENNKKAYWTRIGAAWPNKGGFQVKLETVPVNGGRIEPGNFTPAQPKRQLSTTGSDRVIF